MKRILASFAFIFAVALAGLELVALLDPVGTKMADDADPLGAPSPWSTHLICLLLIGFFFAAGIVLMRRRETEPPADVEPDFGPAGGYDSRLDDPNDDT